MSRARAAELPSRLLRAQFEAIQFVGREEELIELTGWCASADGLSVLLVHGPGGQGKTRLLRRFAAVQAKAAWTVWQARHQMDADAISASEVPPGSPGERGVLVIADYAERWPRTDLQELVEGIRQDSGGRPVRFLLAARPAGTWWRSLRYWLKEEFEVPATALALSPLGGKIPRRELFTAAVGRFSEVLGVSGAELLEAPADLDKEGFDQVLAVHMAALAAVDAHGRGVPLPGDFSRISAYLLQREYAYWERLHASSGGPDSTSPTVMGRAVFTATLAGPLSGDRRWDDGVKILQGVGVAESRDAADAILNIHGLCYPCPVGDMLLQPLYPDQLGEDFLALATPGHGLEQDHPPDPWASRAAIRLTTSSPDYEPPPAQVRKAVTVLTAAAERWPHLRPALADLLRAAPEIAIAGGGVALSALANLPDFDTSVLAAIENLLPNRDVNLDIGHAALTQRLTDESLQTTDDPAERASLYLRLGERLSNAADREEAINATRRAVEIYRQLAQADPVHEPDLGLSLIGLSRRLSEAGRWEEALAAAKEAVEIYRRLAQTDPAMDEPGLALLVNDLCVGLTQIGRTGEALEMRKTAVEVYRRLASSNPVVYAPSLVTSLTDLSGRLSEAGRWEEALGAARGAVEIRSRLRQPDQTAYGPVIIPLLDNLRNRLQEVEQWKVALETVMEALSVNDWLADADPASYDPNLAKSRSNIGLTLSGLRYLGNALDLAEQAAKVYRQLAEADPVDHRPDLSLPLQNLGDHLSKVSRWAEALIATGETAETRRRSAEADLAYLAGSFSPSETQPGSRRSRGMPGAATKPADPASWLPEAAGEELNCTVLMTDVAGFGDPRRNDGDREAVRRALYEIQRSALESSGVPWSDCYCEDRGDGTLIVVPPMISAMRMVDPLIPELASRLRQYNRRASDVVRIQLRAALHLGPVGKDRSGLTGRSIIVAARMLDAPALKERLAASQADLAFAASDYVYDHVIRHCTGRVDFTSFEHVESQFKESRISAWIHLSPAFGEPRAAEDSSDYSRRQGEARSKFGEVPVIAGNAPWKHPTAWSFWNSLTLFEREALAAVGVKKVFPEGTVLYREGDKPPLVIIINTGSAKVSTEAEAEERIVAIRGQGDLVGEYAALIPDAQSFTVTALDEMSAIVVPAERFAEFVRDHPRAAEGLRRYVEGHGIL